MNDQVGNTTTSPVNTSQPSANPSAAALPRVVLETGPNPKHCIVWLHGLGADGYDFVAVAKELDQLGLPATRFVFPHAPKIPVSINGGYVMPAWYDIRHTALDREEDEAGVRQSQAQIEALVEEQLALGFAAHNLVLAGFSQGGAIAYQVALRGQHALAGVLALSTYMPCAGSLAQEQTLQSQSTPFFVGHGNQDTVVPTARGQHAANQLKSRGLSVAWHTYPMAHSVCAEEVQDIAAFLKQVFNNAA